ncbi:MAG: hypothetical protein GY861_14060 [bacterium]|nr:hypothetical protein [bacterium]
MILSEIDGLVLDNEKLLDDIVALHEEISNLARSGDRQEVVIAGLNKIIEELVNK